MIERIELTEQSEFYITGICVRTINNGQAGKDIKALWDRFMNDHIYWQIKEKASDDIYCVYTGYETDHTGYYTAVLGCKVYSLVQVPDGFTAITIPEGNYSVYSLAGKCPQNVLAAWQEIWDSDTDRKYTTDFDVYKPNMNSFEDSEVKIHLAVN